IGGVTPFGLPEGIPVHADARIAGLERVVVGGGSRGLKLVVSPVALERAGVTFVEGLAREVGTAD
ncbi:MAG: hypothetical protein RLZZ272_1224, partial [Actinomycetota bacterium]